LNKNLEIEKKVTSHNNVSRNRHENHIAQVNVIGGRVYMEANVFGYALIGMNTVQYTATRGESQSELEANSY
jgi:hypothetical protein